MSEALAVTSAIHLVLYRVPRDQLETILGHGFGRTLNVLKNFYGTRNAFGTSPRSFIDCGVKYTTIGG